jgi:TolB protein
MMRGLAAIFAAVFLSLGFAPAARAELTIDITQGHLNPMPIAVVDFTSVAGSDAQIGRDIGGLIRANLQRSALFAPIAPAAFIEKVSDINAQPRFADWRIINAQALVIGQTTALPDGRVRIEFRLWDIYGEQQLAGLSYATTPENWRRIAHKVSDAIYEKLTGEKGYFDTRIVFVAESGPAGRTVKRLAIMDQDGANPSFLTTGETQVLTPRFSPTAQQIVYMEQGDATPARTMLFNIETGRREVLANSPGQMVFAPRFMPDGQSVLLTIDQGGNSDIFRVDLRTGARQRLTNNAAIDVSASASPDGQQIVFNSDRGGSQQLYVTSASGGEAKRISFGDGIYSTPVWSPRGDLIAFTKQKGGVFSIGVMRPDGSGERLLTESFAEEGPTWSPNGRVIIFFRTPRGGPPGLWSVDLTGQNLRPAPTPTRASDPAWSPLLP